MQFSIDNAHQETGQAAAKCEQGYHSKVDCQYQRLDPHPANDEGDQEQYQEGKHTPCDSKRIDHLDAKLLKAKISLAKHSNMFVEPWNNNGDVVRMKANKMSKVVEMYHGLAGCITSTRPVVMQTNCLGK